MNKFSFVSKENLDLQCWKCEIKTAFLLSVGTNDHKEKCLI